MRLNRRQAAFQLALQRQQEVRERAEFMRGGISALEVDLLSLNEDIYGTIRLG